MVQRQITFDPSNSGSAKAINNRRVINGPDDGLMQVAPLKHPWGYELFKTMIKNTWMPEEVNMAKDVEQWKANDVLTDNERYAFLRGLAFASNLDGFLVEHLTLNMMRQVTSPEVKMALSRHAFEESVHVDSYSLMVEALGLDPDEVYTLYKKDKELYDKNQHILDSVAQVSRDEFRTGTLENDQEYIKAVAANVVMEGIYFYSFFLLFYVFKRNNKMPGSAEMIQFINRDEDMHLRVFTNMFNTINNEQPEILTTQMREEIVEMFRVAGEEEIEWGLSCIRDGLLGLSAENLTEYIHFLVDTRLHGLGFEPLYNASNPFPWLDEMTQTSMTETNFFEGTVREYQSGALEW